MPGTIAIAAYRTKVLAVLDDAAQARYTTAQVDQALRDALAEYSRALPIAATYIFDADGTQKFTLPADFAALSVYGLEDQATYPPVDYTIYAYYTGEQWVIETPRNTIPSGTSLTLLYAGYQTIDALDSAAGTTIEDGDADIFATGAAGYAMLSRANSRSEAASINPQTADTMRKLGSSLLAIFRTTIRNRQIRQITAAWTLDTDSKF